MKLPEFDKVLKKFLKYLKTQDKLKTSNDLLPRLLYEYIDSLDCNVTRCIMSVGTLINREKHDAQINVEMQYTTTTYVEIYIHKKGKDLSEGWIKQKKPFFGDLMNEVADAIINHK